MRKKGEKKPSPARKTSTAVDKRGRKRLPPTSARKASSIPDAAEDGQAIAGRNPVMEAVKSGRPIDKILAQRDGEGSIKKIIALAKEAGIKVQYVDRFVLDKKVPGVSHQGIIAYAAAKGYSTLDEILNVASQRGEDPFIILLDGVEDPQNLGSIIRSAECTGAHGIVIPSRGSAGLTEAVSRASAGALEYMPVARVSNIAQTIKILKEKGIWVAALDMDGTHYQNIDFRGPVAVVIGGEGKGVSRLVKENCDYVASLPIMGKISSLNASNAAAVIMYEVLKARSTVSL